MKAHRIREIFGQAIAAIATDEHEWDAVRLKFARDWPHRSAGDIDVENRAIERILANQRQTTLDVVSGADHFSTAFTQGIVNVEGNDGVVLNNENPPAGQPVIHGSTKPLRA